MNELIKVTTNDNQEPIISGRDLHEFLEVDTPYSKWIQRMFEYGFIENTDYGVTDIFVHNSNGGKQTQIDHVLKLDMAKELSMIQRNEKGKQARQYFISIEKEFNSPEKIMARALKIADDTIKRLSFENKIKDQQIGEMKPKVDYVDMILKNKSLLTTTQISKDYGMSAVVMNSKLHDLGIQFKQSDQWLLYSKHHNKGYTSSYVLDLIGANGSPYTKMSTKWTQKGRLFLYELLKDNGILPTIERETV